MVRDKETYWPRKSEMGNGPVEIVVGDVLDKARSKILSFPWSRTIFSET